MSALISPRELHDILASPSLKIIDASYPSIDEFHAQAHIGNALPFNVDFICDLNNPLPHMLPTADFFESVVGAMGIGNDDDIVIYDRSGMAMAAARVWWMFRCFGHKSVRVLDGGLPLWHAMGLPLESGPVTAPAEQEYTATFHPELLATRQSVSNALNNETALVIDARPAERFSGTSPDIRPGMPSGHIPGSSNIPFATLLDPATGQLNINDPRIASLAAQDQKIIASCGSGITACVLALALHQAGYENAAVYDGSWAEWGNPLLNLPVATGTGKILP